jgi:hypothetical protein
MEGAAYLPQVIKGSRRPTPRKGTQMLKIVVDDADRGNLARVLMRSCGRRAANAYAERWVDPGRAAHRRLNGSDAYLVARHR